MPHQDPRAALNAAGFAPKISLGQNFIFDEGLLARLVEAAGVTTADDVLEIGPGAGTLTAALAARAHKVVAVEIDPALLPVLEKTLAGFENAAVVPGDILKTDVAALLRQHFGGPAKVVANLPYYITTEVLTYLLLKKLPLATIAVMVQREVGQKMMSRPGEDGYGPLAVYCQYFATVSKAADIPAGCFNPPPKVDSVFMRLDLRRTPPVACADEALLLRVVRAAFAMRRKTMVNNLQAAFSLNKAQAQEILATAGLMPQVRGEALDLPAYAKLADALHERRSDAARNVVDKTLSNKQGK